MRNTGPNRPYCDSGPHKPFLGLNMAEVMSRAMQEMDREARAVERELMKDPLDFMRECYGDDPLPFHVLTALNAEAFYGLWEGYVRATVLAVDSKGEVVVIEGVLVFTSGGRYEPPDYGGYARVWRLGDRPEEVWP